jgi:hypothetical protein
MNASIEIETEAEIANNITLYFDIVDGKVAATEIRGDSEGESAIVASVEDAYKLAERIAVKHGYDEANLSYLFSSSIDFAEEYTSDAAVLAFCAELRG